MTTASKAFISYSHQDSAALDQLVKHLSMLRREELLTEWFDQKILAGGEIDKEISTRLAECDLFLPLVSPDFLASKYCYETEMQRAVDRHEAGTIQIVPVIIEPCDWKANGSLLRRFKAVPQDGKPVSEWTNVNNAYLNVISELRRLIEDAPPALSSSAAPHDGARAPSHRKYRLKRDFDEIDKIEFREAAFGAMRDYFREAIDEINSIESIRGRFDHIGNDGFTCTVVNRSLRQGAAHITVYSQTGRSTFGDISYSFQERAPRGTANGYFSVDNDDYELFLTGNGFGMQQDQQRISPRSAAESLWEDFLSNAGIAHE